MRARKSDATENQDKVALWFALGVEYDAVLRVLGAALRYQKATRETVVDASNDLEQVIDDLSPELRTRIWEATDARTYLRD